MSVRISHAMASRNAPHESSCGDVGAVFEGRGHTLVVVADGLGHGPDARIAAMRAADVASANLDVRLEPLVQLLDRALASTRGAAVSMIRLDHALWQMEFVGVGNVECRARSAKPIQPLAMPGIVGRGVRRVRSWSFPVVRGDMLVLYTDGISSRMELDALDEPSALANAVLARHARGTDDALALALRVDA